MLVSLSDMIARAVQVLREGGIIAFPTETTYGLGCDPRCEKAVKRLFALKGRDQSKPFLLTVGSWKQAHAFVQFHPKAMQLARRYWPGPLTLVLPTVSSLVLAQGVVMQQETAIRYSSSLVVQRLTRRYGCGVVATSANKSGESPCRSFREVREIFGDAIDFSVEVGSLPRRAPSTVARIARDGAVEIIRRGAIRLPKQI